jgi:hypothetical protein
MHRPDSTFVLADEPRTRDLPFFPTLLCLWGAGWIASLVTTLVLVGRVYPTARSPFLLLAASIVVSAAVSAVVVRELLLNVVRRDVSYSGAFLALAAGSAAGTAIRLAFLSQLRHPEPPTGFPLGSLGLSVVPAMAGALVSFGLLQHAARAEPAAESPASGSRPRRGARIPRRKVAGAATANWLRTCVGRRSAWWRRSMPRSRQRSRP